MHKRSYKVLLLGDTGVGKTSILCRLISDMFTHSHMSTVGIDYQNYKVDVDGVEIKLGVWDCAGQERFRSIVRSYFRDAHAAIIVYDVTKTTSYHHVESWYQECLENYDRMDKDKFIFAIAGNKSDLRADRVIRKEQLKEVADKLGIDIYQEVSAKDNVGLENLLDDIANKLYNIHGTSEPISKVETVNLQKSGKKCCFL